jgi:hypothetical protein
MMYGLVWRFELDKRRDKEEKREGVEKLTVRTSKRLIYS